MRNPFLKNPVLLLLLLGSLFLRLGLVPLVGEGYSRCLKSPVQEDCCEGGGFEDCVSSHAHHEFHQEDKSCLDLPFWAEAEAREFHVSGFDETPLDFSFHRLLDFPLGVSFGKLAPRGPPDEGKSSLWQLQTVRLLI